MAGIEPNDKRTLWGDIDKSGVLYKAGTVLGVGGATLNRIGAEAMDYILPPSVPAAAPGARRVQDANFAALEDAWNIKQGIGDKTKSVPPASPIGVQEKAPTAPGIVEPTTGEHPLSLKYGGDPYAAARAIKDDKKFMDFVDKHGDKLPGVGYVKNSATGRITRVIENPATRQEPDYELTNDQAELAIKLLHAKATHAAGVGTKEAALDQRALEAFHKQVEFSGTDENGNKDWDTGFKKTVLSGVPVHPQYKELATQFMAPLNTQIALDEKKKGAPLTPIEKRTRVEQFKKSHNLSYDRTLLGEK